MKHLTRFKRVRLQALRAAGHNQKEIADLIGCHQSTVSRELHRGKTPVYFCYNAEKAQKLSEMRRVQSYDERQRWYDNPAVLKVDSAESKQNHKKNP